MRDDEVRGVTPSFDGFVTAQGGALTRFAYLMVGDHHLGQDLVQEALAKLHRHWPRVSKLDDPNAYVRRMMVNQLTSWRRRRSWTEHSVADIADSAVLASPADDTAERDALWTLLSHLPTQQRAVIVLRFYEDLDDQAIATVVGCSTATVRSHASKGLARLRSGASELDPTYGGHR